MVSMCVVAAVLTAGCGNNRGKSAQSAAKTEETAVKAGAVSDERGYIVRVGNMVPDFDLLMMDGTTLNIKELRGKVVMLQFTASWCGVCRQEMPTLRVRYGCVTRTTLSLPSTALTSRRHPR